MPVGKMYLAGKPVTGRKRRPQYVRNKFNKYNYNNRYNQLAVIKRPVCAPRMIVPLKYVSEVLQLVCTSGADNYHLFNANSIYDCDRTGTGHQPLGADQWQLFYSHYRVLSSKISVTAQSSTNANFNLVINSMPSTSGATGIDPSREGRGKCRTGGDQGKIVRLSQFRKIANIIGVSKRRILDDDVYGAAFGASPAGTCCWQIWAQPFDEATTTTITFKVAITYYVLLTYPAFLTQS